MHMPGEEVNRTAELLEEYFKERLDGLKRNARAIVDDMKNCRLRFVVDELPRFIRDQDEFIEKVDEAEKNRLISEDLASDLIIDALRAKWGIDAAAVDMWVYCTCRREGSSPRS